MLSAHIVCPTRVGYLRCMSSMNGRISIYDGGSNPTHADGSSELHCNQLLLLFVGGPLNHNCVLVVSVLWCHAARQCVVDDLLNIEVNSGTEGLVDAASSAQVPDAFVIASINSTNRRFPSVSVFLRHEYAGLRSIALFSNFVRFVNKSRNRGRWSDLCVAGGYWSIGVRWTVVTTF